jgi:hypothetical protein
MISMSLDVSCLLAASYTYNSLTDLFVGDLAHLRILIFLFVGDLALLQILIFLLYSAQKTTQMLSSWVSRRVCMALVYHIPKTLVCLVKPTSANPLPASNRCNHL